MVQQVEQARTDACNCADGHAEYHVADLRNRGVSQRPAHIGLEDRLEAAGYHRSEAQRHQQVGESRLLECEFRTEHGEQEPDQRIERNLRRRSRQEHGHEAW